MRNDARSITVQLTFLDEFNGEALLERELVPLRAFLPDLMRELAELIQLEQDKE